MYTELYGHLHSGLLSQQCDQRWGVTVTRVNNAVEDTNVLFDDNEDEEQTENLWTVVKCGESNAFKLNILFSYSFPPPPTLISSMSWPDNMSAEFLLQPVCAYILYILGN